MEIKTHHATLSQAIREGAKLSVQGYDTYFPHPGASCALGAAIEGLYGYEGRENNHGGIHLARAFPYIDNTQVGCPVVDCGGESDLDNQIAHLNDDHRWTRNAIADFVESVEEKLGFVTVVDTQNGASASPLSQEVEQHDAVSAST